MLKKFSNCYMVGSAAHSIPHRKDSIELLQGPLLVCSSVKRVAGRCKAAVQQKCSQGSEHL